jgi:hypothetical protein
MKRALVLVGSPRGKKSNSSSIGFYLLDRLQEKGLETEILWINRLIADDEKLHQILDSVDNADIIILTAPLYDDCQPYIVTRTMEAIAAHQKSRSDKRFIPIVNCGLPEPEHITSVVISIYHKFASTVGFKWAGSLAIGGGEILQGPSGKKLDDLGKMAARIKKTLERISDALAAGESFSDESLRAVPDFFYKPFMKKIITRINTRGWKSRAKKKGEAVDAQPYLRNTE